MRVGRFAHANPPGLYPECPRRCDQKNEEDSRKHGECPVGNVVAGMEGWVATAIPLSSPAIFGVARIRARARIAMSVKRSRGERISGHSPFGWDFGRGGRLVRNAREQKIIARVRRLRATG